MGNELLAGDIARLLPEVLACADSIRLEACGGGNNRVYAFEAGGRQYVAKWYFNHPTDRRDRLFAEYAFLSYALQVGVSCVPRPIARDDVRNLAIYERVSGRRPEPGTIGVSEVDQASAFFVALNRMESRALARTLPEASEAGFSVAQHFEVVRRRMQRLSTISDETEIDTKARAYADRLNAAWKQVMRTIQQRLAAAGEPLEREVMARCVSPSDFGFHNALVDGGQVRFVDFEYAGWDDPAKMAGDFFCQPAVPVPSRLHDRFLDAAMSFSPHASVLAARARLLLPVFQIKWCCIMLNDFLPDAARRRRFADPTLDAGLRKREQLAKAERLLDSIAR